MPSATNDSESIDVTCTNQNFRKSAKTSDSRLSGVKSTNVTRNQSPSEQEKLQSVGCRRFSFEQNMCSEKTLVDYRPVGTWIEHNTNSGNSSSKRVHISSSFISVGLSISCHSTTSIVMISGLGISKIKILMRGEDVKKGPSHLSVSEMVITESLTDEKGIQRITLDLPLPCKTVEVLVTEKKSDFVCIFDVRCFSSSIRPSALSTPTPALQQNNFPDDDKFS
jgi:hypothetical protein